MSDEKRTINDIQGEYQSLCTRAGHLQYQIYALEGDLKLVNDSLKGLNLEAATVQAEAVKAKAAADEEAKAKESGIEKKGE